MTDISTGKSEIDFDDGLDAALAAAAELASSRATPAAPGAKPLVADETPTASLMGRVPSIAIDDDIDVDDLDAALAGIDFSANAPPPAASSKIEPLGISLEATMAELAIAPAIDFGDDDAALSAAMDASLAEISIDLAAEHSAAALVSDVHDAPAPTPAKARRGNPFALSKRMRWWPMATVGLAGFASVVSAIGLVVATRSVNEASLVVADARERQVQMRKVEELIDDLEHVRAREIAMLQKLERMERAQPATRAEVGYALEKMKSDLLKSDAQGTGIRFIHEGQQELAERMDAVLSKVDRLEATLTASRTGSRATGRAPAF